jgi:hypothetical protein
MRLPGDGPARTGKHFFAGLGGFLVDASFAPPGLSVYRFCPTACAVGCILTPLSRLVDSWILVRLDRQILILAHILVQIVGQKNSRFGPKSRKQRTGIFLAS